jgi:hypothetical protein
MLLGCYLYHQLSMALYCVNCTPAQAELQKLMASVGNAVPLSEYIPAKLLLARAQLFQGKLTAAKESCTDAVAVCEGSRGFTPDTEALAAALHHLGVMQLLTKSTADAETSLVRAARLGNTEADHAKVRNFACLHQHVSSCRMPI